MNSTQT